MLAKLIDLGTATVKPFTMTGVTKPVWSFTTSCRLSGDGAQLQRGHTLDCPLCVHFGSAAPPPAPIRLPQAQPLADALRPVPTAHIAARTAAPLPARGPPFA